MRVLTLSGLDLVFQQCRARIDEQASPEERENLLAVTQVLAGLRYKEVGLFQLLGGRNAMIESPVLQELKAEWTRDAVREAKRRSIIDFLVARFGRAYAPLFPGFSGVF